MPFMKKKFHKESDGHRCRLPDTYDWRLREYLPGTKWYCRKCGTAFEIVLDFEGRTKTFYKWQRCV